MKKAFLLLVATSVVGTCFGQAADQAKERFSAFQLLVQDAKTRVKEMDIDQLKLLVASGEKFLLIDVREDSEWAAGHAARAIHISKGVIERDIETKVPQKNSRLVLYCGSGSRSLLATDSLTKMGYSNVNSLAGGMKAYQAAGLPSEK